MCYKYVKGIKNNHRMDYWVTLTLLCKKTLQNLLNFIPTFSTENMKFYIVEQ